MHREGSGLGATAGILSRRALLAGVFAAGLSSIAGQTIADEDGVSGVVSGEIVNALSDGVAMDGFDVVAYFDGAPAKGLASNTVDYKGTSWLFSSPENASAFAADPGAYEPRYNGWCAYAVSEGYGAEVDFVNGWSILEGKLYLNWDADTREAFLSEQSTRIERAERNWPDLHAALLDGSAAMYTHAGEGVAIVHPQRLD
ncbi:MAG: YHS domain protein [bacterium]|nr:YHS domain protein [bacterium]MDE0417504.1 YHS domain protein [bacterium]